MANKFKLKKEAKKKIQDCFNKAKNSPDSDKLIKKAYKLALKTRTKLPKTLKRRFCKHCFTYFTAKNHSVRITGKTITYTCLNCKKWIRFGYRKR